MMVSIGLPLAILLVISYLIQVANAGNFNKDFDISWGNEHAKIANNGKLLTLSLDKTSGSGFQSKNEYLFGKFDMRIKLVPGNSAGTVTAYYMSSQGDTHDEIDFEFLGNVTGQPYIVHTNIFTQGQGNREQQFYLWFDPTLDFHTYSILWNPQLIILYVDRTPIRVFKNMESKAIPFPKTQPMRLYGSIWDAEDWATQGGLVKTNWSASPFTASFSNFKPKACLWNSTKGSSSCTNLKLKPPLMPSPSSSKQFKWLSQELDFSSQKKLKWVRKKYMVYDYCADTKRFPQGVPSECNVTNDAS